MASQNTNNLLQEFQHLNAPQLRRLLVEHLTRQKLGLYWESNAIQRDAALNANVVLPRLAPEFSHTPKGTSEAQRAIDLLQERRTALISAAVTGQIDVRGAVQSL